MAAILQEIAFQNSQTGDDSFSLCWSGTAGLFAMGRGTRLSFNCPISAPKASLQGLQAATRVL
jgi:hypothetical protein